jgi:hypothetical protein
VVARSAVDGLCRPTPARAEIIGNDTRDASAPAGPSLEMIAGVLTVGRGQIRNARWISRDHCVSIENASLRAICADCVLRHAAIDDLAAMLARAGFARPRGLAAGRCRSADAPARPAEHSDDAGPARGRETPPTDVVR